MGDKIGYYLALAGAVAINFLIPGTGAFATLLRIGASVGVAALASSLAPKPKPQDGQQVIRQPVPPRISGFGTNRVSGAYLLYETNDAGASADVLAMHAGRIAGVDTYYLNDLEVTVDVDGWVSAAEHFGFHKVRLLTNLGLATETAFAAIVAAIADDDIWGDDHRGDGIATLGLLCAEVDQDDIVETYPNGLPAPNVVARLQRVWDPRDEDQDPDDPDTLAYSANPVLQLLWYLTRAAGGLGLDLEEFITPNLAEWKAAADVCETTSPLKAGGTEPLYECHGVYRHDADPSQVVAAILGTFDGWLAPKPDGSIGIKAGRYEAPTVTIDSSHILSFSVEFEQAIDSRVSVLTAQYISVDDLYSPQDADPWVDEDVLDEIGEKTAPFDLTWVHSHPQGRRLMKRQMRRLNAGARGTMTTDLAGFDAIGCRFVTLKYPAFAELANVPIEIDKFDVNLDGDAPTATISWHLADPNVDAWNPATEEGTAPTTPKPGAGAPLFPPEDFAAELLIDFFAGTLLSYGVLTWTPLRPTVSYTVQWRLVGDGTAGIKTINTAGGVGTVSFSPLSDAADYEARIRSKTPGGRSSDWTDWVPIPGGAILLADDGIALATDAAGVLGG